ncbi:hypothetical protein DERF_000129 [Dermatophagoides farinae]|uniref:Uncharacterized protein n=1 Tax=Dermatophagoides farinae TaxID=6954 RepID=A0A922I9C5_DERFA|nr:hypothetical protein DERF_000129 [Dermatophagoides farinae]
MESKNRYNSSIVLQRRFIMVVLRIVCNNSISCATLRLALILSRCSADNDVTRRFSLRRSRCSAVNADIRRFALIISRCSCVNGERNFLVKLLFELLLLLLLLSF